MTRPTNGQKALWTVQQLASAAGVTPRTLRHYDAIGLLSPSTVGDNGYRYYNEAAALRLQQILFYRELGIELSAIRDVMDAPEFETAAALQRHRAALLTRASRLQHLIHTIDRTLLHLQGQIEMTTQDLFAGFDEETQTRYEQEAAKMYNPQIVADTSRRWKSYSTEDRARIQREGGEIYQEMVALLDRDPGDATMQALVGRWHNHLRAFYEPTPEILRGLGQAYEEDPRFAAFYAALHPDLPAFLHRAIDIYVSSGAAG